MAGAILCLPTECFLHVCNYLSVKDLASLGCSCRAFSQMVQDDSVWRSVAVAKWGDKVLLLRTGKETNWPAYCKHRMSFKQHPPSPLHLIQERYSDTWQHLVCCILCSRTTGGDVVRATIQGFLDRFPTPSAVLAADPKVIKTAINPVGLQDVRHKALTSMSHDFLAEDWTDPSSFYGCGAFAVESWRIFCLGELDLKGVTDATLKRYLRWRRTGQAEEQRKSTSQPVGRHGKRKRIPPPLTTRTLRSGRKR